jgi:transcriptional regulator with XRE-family HTH domain
MVELNISERLSQYMLRRSLSQAELSRELGIKPPQLNRWLRKGRISRLWVEELKRLGVLD